MKDFLVSVLTAIMALGGTCLLVYGVLSLFIKSKSIKLKIDMFFFITVLLVMLFGMDELNTFGVIVGTIITCYLGAHLFSGGNDSNNNTGSN